MKRQSNQSGAVSLFVVIFAMLVLSVMTISFLRIMMSDQRQASDNDLSQSAYDSAQAGVEDAKRALLRYQATCRASGAGACADEALKVASNVCNRGVVSTGAVSMSNVNGGTPTNPGEVIVQRSSTTSDAVLNQAYTCLKIKLTTDDYIGQLAAGESRLVPLITEDGQTFDTVTVRWFSNDDVSGAGSSLDIASGSSGVPLLQQANWPSTRPSVMRSQLIQIGNSFTLNSFDSTSGGRSNANTVFLYPIRDGSTPPTSFTARDIRKDTPTGNPLPSTPVQTRCSTNISGGGYACEMSLLLPAPIGGGPIQAAYLRLTPYYNASHFQVLLSRGGPVDASGSNLRKFKDVQPEIDSTGRANDLFRRILTRVDLYDTSFPYPDATLDVTGNLCKDFSVTNSSYIPGTCTP